MDGSVQFQINFGSGTEKMTVALTRTQLEALRNHCDKLLNPATLGTKPETVSGAALAAEAVSRALAPGESL